MSNKKKRQPANNTAGNAAKSAVKNNTTKTTKRKNKEIRTFLIDIAIIFVLAIVVYFIVCVFPKNKEEVCVGEDCIENIGTPIIPNIEETPENGDTLKEDNVAILGFGYPFYVDGNEFTIYYKKKPTGESILSLVSEQGEELLTECFVGYDFSYPFLFKNNNETYFLIESELNETATQSIMYKYNKETKNFEKNFNLADKINNVYIDDTSGKINILVKREKTILEKMDFLVRLEYNQDTNRVGEFAEHYTVNQPIYTTLYDIDVYELPDHEHTDEHNHVIDETKPLTIPKGSKLKLIYVTNNELYFELMGNEVKKIKVSYTQDETTKVITIGNFYDYELFQEINDKLNNKE